MTLLAAAALAAAAIACGSGSPRETIAANASLDIRVTLEGGAPRRATLVCGSDSATGTGYLQSADAAHAACALVLSEAGSKRLIEGAPRDQACTQIYGGPQKGTVTGTIRGRKVDTTFTRTDGCRIAEWTAFERILGKPQ